jgi:lantibiotic biosynthesis protein
VINFITWSSNYLINSSTQLKLKERIDHLLKIIDNEIENRLYSEKSDLLDGLGGVSMYYLNRYYQTENSKFESQSIEILEKIVFDINCISLPNYISLGIPSVAPCWLIDQYVNGGFLEEGEKNNSKSIIDFIVSSTSDNELNNNFHDLFYGFIGKALILIENSKEGNRSYVDKIIDILKTNSIPTDNGIYWNTPNPFYRSIKFERTINYGIPHGSCGIILFLLKCCHIYNLHDELMLIVKRSIDWLMYQLNNENNRLRYYYSSKELGDTGKLGWCYGDQTVAFTLLRYYETFNCSKALSKAWELIEQAAAKPIDQTGVRYYPKYGYYDMRVCHGTSSVAYMWKKMFDITGDNTLKALSDKWLGITLDNLEIFLPQLEKIAILEKENDTIDTSMGFINGLSGVGLVLISFLDPKLSGWDKLLLLDRPERE